jgi:hypothetical protein
MGAPSNLDFNLAPTFFGFKPEHQIQFHEQLFDLIWAGDGKWDWDTVYNLPLHIRKLWINKINKYRTADNNEPTSQKTITAKIPKHKST